MGGKEGRGELGDASWLYLELAHADASVSPCLARERGAILEYVRGETISTDGMGWEAFFRPAAGGLGEV